MRPFVHARSTVRPARARVHEDRAAAEGREEARHDHQRGRQLDGQDAQKVGRTRPRYVPIVGHVYVCIAGKAPQSGHVRNLAFHDYFVLISTEQPQDETHIKNAVI